MPRGLTAASSGRGSPFHSLDRNPRKHESMIGMEWLMYGGLGLLGMVLGELAFHPLQRLVIDPDKTTDPLWKRFAHALVLLAFGCAVLIIGVYLNGKL
jgi:hypothetical protein